MSKTECNSWLTLGAQAERNKENNAKPAKWTSYKVLHISKTHFFIFLFCVLYKKYPLNKDVENLFKFPLLQILQRPGPGVGGATASSLIEVFIDEECAK